MINPEIKRNGRRKKAGIFSFAISSIYIQNLELPYLSTSCTTHKIHSSLSHHSTFKQHKAKV